MTIYRYEVVTPNTVETINRLLIRGWKPSREVPLNVAAAGDTSTAVLVVLERDDTEPVALSATLGGSVPVELLEAVPLLNGLTHEELADLVGIADVRNVPNGDVIFEEGSSELGLCIILRGEVELRLTHAGSSGVEIMQIGERDAFGESSFFSGSPHAAQASAATDALLLVIPREGYDELLQASRPAAWKLAINAAGILGVRLQQTDQWLSELLQHEEDARITQSLKRYRESVGRGSFKASPFFGT